MRYNGLTDHPAFCRPTRQWNIFSMEALTRQILPSSVGGGGGDNDDDGLQRGLTTDTNTSTDNPGLNLLLLSKVKKKHFLC
jgi:hypothetical protein